MTNQIIQDYGKTISPERYIETLQEHQYIPQADQCIKNIIQRFCTKPPFIPQVNILDVGCGPGRLTSDLGLLDSIKIGVDISQDFINYAWKSFLNKNKGPDLLLSFQKADFTESVDFTLPTRKVIRNFDIILMQGVMHHIHGEDRGKFLNRSFELLKPEGILIVGDEFIPGYESERDRTMKAAQWYSHIIDEARNGGFHALAEEEARNLIDDCFSGTEFSGLTTKEAFEVIYRYSEIINKIFYEYGLVGLNNKASSDVYNMLDDIKADARHLVGLSEENFSRGDRKVSINVFADEVSLYGFDLEEIYRIGPVDWLGGMGVLVFKKR